MESAEDQWVRVVSWHGEPVSWVALAVQHFLRALCRLAFFALLLLAVPFLRRHCCAGLGAGFRTYHWSDAGTETRAAVFFFRPARAVFDLSYDLCLRAYAIVFCDCDGGHHVCLLVCGGGHHVCLLVVHVHLRKLRDRGGSFFFLPLFQLLLLYAVCF